MIQLTCPCGASLDAAPDPTRCPVCGRDLPLSGDAVALRTTNAPRARDCPSKAIQSKPPTENEPDLLERLRRPAASGKAIASLVFGVLSLFPLAAVTGLPALLLAVLGLRDIGRSNGSVRGKWVALAGLVTGALGTLATTPLLIFLVFIPLDNRRQSANDLKELALAMHYYNDATGNLPPVGPADPKTGAPQLSWRVSILPYIGYVNLYNQFHQDEPWDGPNNSRLIPLMPKVYALPRDATTQPGFTHYRVFVGGGAPFNNDSLASFPRSFPDGQSNTILIVEAGGAVPWTKPDELTYDPDGPLPPLGGRFPGGFMAVMGDGSVRWIDRSFSTETLRQAINANDGCVIGSEW